MNDTSQKIREKMKKLIFKKSPEERLRMGCSMYDFSKRLVTDAILRENPDLSQNILRGELYLTVSQIMIFQWLSFPHAAEQHCGEAARALSASRSSGGRPRGHLAPPLERAPVGRLVLRCRTVGTAYGRYGVRSERRESTFWIPALPSVGRNDNQNGTRSGGTFLRMDEELK